MGDHAHGDPCLAHHFDDMPQQVEAGKMGMWLFLATEVLLFAGLFCAYTVYRFNNPEVFAYASQYLDRIMGAVNTIILLASSFTAAWAVKAAQEKKKQLTVVLLLLTILGGAGFMVVKYFEYSHKFHDHLKWGMNYDPANTTKAVEMKNKKLAEKKAAEPKLASATTKINDAQVAYEVEVPGVTKQDKKANNIGPPATSVTPSDAKKRSDAPADIDPAKLQKMHIFFGIYFVMTGLHGLHVLIGMIVLGWVAWRANRGDFDNGYYLPVDLAALYWHLVDLIWIYLFPLLYLI